MIRINLLPVRAAKKKETVKQQATIAISSIVAVLLIFVALYSVTLGKISGTKNDITSAEGEIQQLKKKIGEIDNLKKLQAEVAQREHESKQQREARLTKYRKEEQRNHDLGCAARSWAFCRSWRHGVNSKPASRTCLRERFCSTQC